MLHPGAVIDYGPERDAGILGRSLVAIGELV